MKYFEMFAGVGGFGLGIQNAYNTKCQHISKESQEEKRPQGRERSANEPEESVCGSDGTAPLCVGFSEIDKYASQVLKYHYPDVKNYGDCKTINWSEVPDFDLLTGGSPCQDLSIAGKRAGIGGARSGLVWEYIRCLQEKKPRYFIWENVKGALSSNRGFDFATILTAFSEAGYSLWWQVCNAKDFGVPQNRERVFVCGFRDGSPPEIFFERGTDGKDIQVVNKGASQHYRQYDTGGVAPTLQSQSGWSSQKHPFIAQRVPLKYLNRNQKQIEGDYAFTVDSMNTEGVAIMNMHISARNPNRKSANRGGSAPLLSQDKSFAVETGQPHYVIETDKTK